MVSNKLKMVVRNNSDNILAPGDSLERLYINLLTVDNKIDKKNEAVMEYIKKMLNKKIA
jgi:hypothetical protein